MSASFPSALKAFTNPTSLNSLNVPAHATQHADANDEIVAIETELGTTPKGTYGTVKLRLDDAVYKAGAQTVAGVKTFSSFPITPSSAPTTNYQVANKKYVDDNVIQTTRIQIFTANGTFTAPTGVTKVYLTQVGGGGGGGGGGTSNHNGGGGGGGSAVINYPYTVVAASTYSVSIGTGGAAGTVGNNGSDGGSSIFDTLTVLGGQGGRGGTSTAHGNGGLGGTSYKGPGIMGNTGGSINDILGRADGGGSIVGVGATVPMNQTGTAAAANSGGGGSGQNISDGNTYAGGAGGSGVVIVMY